MSELKQDCTGVGTGTVSCLAGVDGSTEEKKHWGIFAASEAA